MSEVILTPKQLALALASDVQTRLEAYTGTPWAVSLYVPERLLRGGLSAADVRSIMGSPVQYAEVEIIRQSAENQSTLDWDPAPVATAQIRLFYEYRDTGVFETSSQADVYGLLFGTPDGTNLSDILLGVSSTQYDLVGTPDVRLTVIELSENILAHYVQITIALR